MSFNWLTIAKSMRGFELPFSLGGVSWEPPVLWRDVAQEVITFLEPKRVLYNTYELETPNRCVSSVVEIRNELTTQLKRLDNEPGLPAHLRYMRGACNDFLDTAEKIEKQYGRIDTLNSGHSAWDFIVALGQLRATFGIHLGLIAAQHKLGIEGKLATILPKPPADS